MQRFEQAFSALSTTTAATTSGWPAGTRGGNSMCGNDTGARHAGRDSSVRQHQQQPDSIPAVHSAQQQQQQPQQQHVPDAAPLAPAWRSGPAAGAAGGAAGTVARVCERPILCMAAMRDGSGCVVLGSSDHALYVVDGSTGATRRTLFSRASGHSEWVTTVCCLPGGRVLSGGMDGRLWLWPPTGSGGVALPGAHTAPVSKVALLAPACASCPAGSFRRQHSSSSSSSSSGRGGRGAAGWAAGPRAAAAAGSSGSSGSLPAMAASCSYDATVRLWDVPGSRGQRARQAALLRGHQAPVLEMAVHPSCAALLTGGGHCHRCCCNTPHGAGMCASIGL
jgi:hypothetical protein